MMNSEIRNEIDLEVHYGTQQFEPELDQVCANCGHTYKDHLSFQDMDFGDHPHICFAQEVIVCEAEISYIDGKVTLCGCTNFQIGTPIEEEDYTGEVEI